MKRNIAPKTGLCMEDLLKSPWEIVRRETSAVNPKTAHRGVQSC